MKNRLILYLLPEEREALMRMAESDVRPPDAQIRFLLINEAVRRGFLTSDKSNSDAKRLEPVNAAVAGIVQ
jgi:hypothetical protein